MQTIESIISLTKALRERRDMLAVQVDALNNDIAKLQAETLPTIRRLVRVAADRYSELYAAIDQSRGLFNRPRTIVAHNFRLGLRKGAGGIVIEDPERTVALVKKHLPEQAGDLIETKEKPRKKAIAGLDIADAKRIGCQVEATGDVVFIKPIDTVVDKIVSALFKSAAAETDEQQEAA